MLLEYQPRIFVIDIGYLAFVYSADQEIPLAVCGQNVDSSYLLWQSHDQFNQEYLRSHQMIQ